MRRRFAALTLVVAVATLPGCTSESDASMIDDCVRADLGGRSVARVWDEALLDSIRRDVPAPTVHARNLFHTSAAMWDAWAAFDPEAEGYFVDEKLEADDAHAAREEAISFAAYRILLWRYSKAAGLQETFDELVNTVESLCYRIDFTGTEGDSPAALGNRIAAAVVEFGRDDGSLEEQRYIDSAYRPVNPPLVVAEPTANMLDPNRWQPLALAQFVAQNGLPIPGNVQRFVGPHWGHVQGFALPTSPEGTNDGDGHEANPATGSPYAPNVVLRGDFTRVLAQFWADGPASETPPGHWNTIANEVSDSQGFEHRIGGEDPEVNRLEWDVKLYFALNGAVHDAAVAAWGVKGHYDSARPISMIRYLGSKRQLPLARGLVEVITRESSARGA